jgi:uncharacterized membrane protein YkvI
MTGGPTFFQRLLLPGFAFKAVVIGGGYATGRELVEFFFASGPWGGLFALALVAVIWSTVCAMTFLVARALGSYDYRSFFQGLLGPAWRLFDLAYLLLMLLVLSVLAAAAGEIFGTTFNLPPILGTIGLMTAIIAITGYGRQAVEQFFKYASLFLYSVYALCVLLVFTRFGDRIGDALALGVSPEGWASSGVTYASYNLVAAIVILPVIRHMTSQRDALVAGLLCGPLAAVPAFLFFLCLLAFYPEVGGAALPSETMLAALGIPLFHITFQIMILIALLETGTGLVHALNERIGAGMSASGRTATVGIRLATSVSIFFLAVFVATGIGLVTLIARGYTFSAYVFLLIYILPLLIVGPWILFKRRSLSSTADRVRARAD